MKRFLKKMIALIAFIKVLLQTYYIRIKKGKCVFFIATPVYQNLGDYAIVYAQFQLLKDIHVKDYIVELNRFEYEMYRELLVKLVIKKRDIIIIDGGGNIGTLWPEEENKIRDIISRFPDNAIYIFPQTAYFENTAYGKSELQKSVKIYNAHRNLTIFCRDSDTYLLIKKHFTNVHSYYTPDIVMYLNQTRERIRGNICLLCFRKDKECLPNQSAKDAVINYFSTKQYSVIETTTIASGKISKTNRFQLLQDKWEEFSSAKLIVTDRLHGMIFAAITGTPCLALDNISHKVKNGYHWLEHLEYIIFCDDASRITSALNDVEQFTEKRFAYSNKQIEHEFDLIKEILQSEIWD